MQNTENYIPRFKEVLELIKGRVPIIIELKYDAPYGKLEKKVIEILKEYKGKYVIKSFNPFSVFWLKKHHPEIIRGQLSCDFEKDDFNIFKKFILKNMLFNNITKPDFISYGIHSLPNKRVEKFRKRKLVLGWTIRNKSELEKAKKYCDNFICENINEL